MIDWRRNLALLWICQVLSLMGFSFAMPFLPLYIREMGINDPQILRLWSGMLMAGAGVSFAVMTPIWGSLSDRWGRKPMTLRANLGGAVIMVSISTRMIFWHWINSSQSSRFMMMRVGMWKILPSMPI